MHTYKPTSVSNTLIIFHSVFLLLEPYCLHSVDTSVWDAQAESQTPKRYLFARHPYSGYLGNRHMWKLSEALFSHLFLFSAQSVASYVYVGSGYKLYQSNYSCTVSTLTLLSSAFQQLTTNICWWMERPVSGRACCSTRNTRISAETLQIIYMNFWSRKKVYITSEEMPIYNCTGRTA